MNSILALGKPASSPGGAMAQIVDELTPAVNTGMAGLRLRQELKNMRNINEQIEAQTRLARFQGSSAYANAEMDNMMLDVYEKNPWLREFAAISRAVGGSKIGSAAGALNAMKDRMKEGKN